MHSLLALLFGITLAGLVYGLSLLPSTSLGQTEETEELASRADQENSKVIDPNTEATSRGSHGRSDAV
jgi:hypothetical protein